MLRCERGAVLVEYALVLTLLSFLLMAGMYAVDGATATAYTYVTNELMNYAERNGN